MPRCSLSNIGSCVTEAFFEFFADLLNLPVVPLLNIIGRLLTEPVRINLFFSLWSTIVYILSMFYGLFIVWQGFKFILSGESPEKREEAKRGLSRIIIMIILVQGSYILYEVLVDVLTAISKVLYEQIPSYIFRIEISNISNLGLQLALLIPYIITLVITVIFLTMRYMIVSIGVVFFAIGIFFYFFDPLISYGRLIINYLITVISLPIFYSIILLAASRVFGLSTFGGMPLVVMIGAYSLINFGTILILIFVIVKAASAASPSIKVIRSIAA